MHPINLKNSRAQIFIEILVALAITSIVLVGIATIAVRGLRIHVQNVRWQNADFLSTEAIEAVRQIRDGFGSISFENGTYQTDWVWDNSDQEESHPVWLEGDTTWFRLYNDPGNGWVLDRNDNHSSELDEYYQIYRDESGGFGYPDMGGFPTDAEPTGYYRSIGIEDYLVGSDLIGKVVTVSLTWEDNYGVHSSELRTVLGIW